MHSTKWLTCTYMSEEVRQDTYNANYCVYVHVDTRTMAEREVTCTCSGPVTGKLVPEITVIFL